MKDNKPTTRELFRRIAKLSSEAEWTAEEKRQALSEAGISPEQVTEHVLGLVARLKKESPFHWKTKALATRRELLERVQARIQAELAGLTRPQLAKKLDEAIRHLPAPAAARYGVAFRKFEDATEEDLRSMLEELAIIEDLEQEQD